jgi:spore coat protein H
MMRSLYASLVSQLRVRGIGLLGALTLASASAAGSAAPPAKTSIAEIAPEAFFDLQRVWQIHLTLAPDQWAAMEPKGMSERTDAAQRPFGPATFNVPLFLGQGDGNHDGRLSHEEFTALGRAWFTAWDTEHAGRLTREQLRAGINNTLDRGLQGRDGRNGVAAMMGIEFPNVRADLEIEGRSFPSVSIRYKGNGTFLESRRDLKRSLKIDLDRGFPGRRFAGVTKLNLHSNVSDPSWMNETLSYRLFREAGLPASRTTYAHVSLTVPGKYEKQDLGLYSVVENVDRQFLEDRFGSSAGALFKPVTPRLLEQLGAGWAAYQQPYDPKTPVTEAQQRRLMDFCALVSKASDAELAARLPDYVDLDELARFLAVTVWLSHLDSILGMGQNLYVYLHPVSGRFVFITWDLDHSFGQFPMVGTREQRETLQLGKPWFGQVRFLERLFALPAFESLYLAKLKELSETLARPERFQRQVDELAPVLRPYVAAESGAKLARFDKAVAGELVVPAGLDGGPPGDGGPHPAGGPSFGPPPGSRDPVKPIKTFVVARARSVADQLAGRAAGATVRGPRFGEGGSGGGGFEPARFLLPVFLGAFDLDRDGELTEAEFQGGIERWFTSWNTDASGVLNEDQLWAGINKDFAFSASSPPREPRGERQ